MKHENPSTFPSADTTDTVDLQIIGGGLAGLVAANRAVDAGLTVRLIERSGTPGGRAVSADHHGYTLNVGPHALYLEGELRQTLLGFDIDPAGAPPELAGSTGSVGDRIGLLPVGAGALVRSRLLSVGSKRRFATVFTGIQRTEPADVASLTVDEWLDRLTDRPDLRATLWGLINLATYNAASDRASADAAVSQIRLGGTVRYVAGGWATIVTALAERADRLGVTRIEAKATSVETSAGSGSDDAGTGAARTIVVTADGHRLPATTCLIASGGPAVADRLLGLDGHFASPAGPPVEASVLDLGLRRRPAVGAHLGLDTALYATVHSVTAGLAPPERHLVTTARYRRPGDDVGPDETRAMLLAHAEVMGVDPADIEIERYLHRLTVTAGMPLAERGGMAGRPPVVVAGRPGVLVAGDWVGPRGLLADAAAASAVDAVDAAVTAVEQVGSPGSRRQARLVG